MTKKKNVPTTKGWIKTHVNYADATPMQKAKIEELEKIQPRRRCNSQLAVEKRASRRELPPSLSSKSSFPGSAAIDKDYASLVGQVDDFAIVMLDSPLIWIGSLSADIPAFAFVEESAAANPEEKYGLTKNFEFEGRRKEVFSDTNNFPERDLLSSWGPTLTIDELAKHIFKFRQKHITRAKSEDNSLEEEPLTDITRKPKRLFNHPALISKRLHEFKKRDGSVKNYEWAELLDVDPKTFKAVEGHFPDWCAERIISAGQRDLRNLHRNKLVAAATDVAFHYGVLHLRFVELASGSPDEAKERIADIVVRKLNPNGETFNRHAKRFLDFIRCCFESLPADLQRYAKESGRAELHIPVREDSGVGMPEITQPPPIGAASKRPGTRQDQVDIFARYSFVETGAREREGAIQRLCTNCLVWWYGDVAWYLEEGYNSHVACPKCGSPEFEFTEQEIQDAHARWGIFQTEEKQRVAALGVVEARERLEATARKKKEEEEKRKLLEGRQAVLI